LPRDGTVEIPIVEMLMRWVMGKGPVLALSLPSILVIYRVIGTQKTLVFCTLVVIMSTMVGALFGLI